MASAALAGAIFLWSATFIALKIVLEIFDPVPMLFCRMGLSFCFVLPYLVRCRQGAVFIPGFSRPASNSIPQNAGPAPDADGASGSARAASPRAFTTAADSDHPAVPAGKRSGPLAAPRAKMPPDGWIFLLLFACDPCLYFLFEGYALRYTSAGQAGMVAALLPLLVGAMAFVVLRERLSARVWLGLFLAVVGVVLLTLTGETGKDAPNPFLGNTLEFFAMIAGACYTLCVRRLRGYPPFFLSALQAGAGTLFFGLLLMLGDSSLPRGLPPGAFSLFGIQGAPLYIAALLYLSFATIVAYGLYNMGVARLSAGQAAAWINGIPAVTLMLGVLLLGERLTAAQCLALLPIVFGVFLSQHRKR